MGQKIWSGYRESNSEINLGKVSGYLYIIPAYNLLYIKNNLLATAFLKLFLVYLVRPPGLEPGRTKAGDFKSPVYYQFHHGRISGPA